MRLNEVKDVTVKSADSSRIRQSIIQYFYGKTNDAKTKAAVFCKRNPGLVHKLVNIAIKVIDAAGNFSGDKIYTGNNEDALRAKLSTIGSTSQVPPMGEYFSDAMSSEESVEVAYPNFAWRDEYLPIRVRVDGNLLINYYNMLYSYFDNWYKLDDEFKELNSHIKTESGEEKKIEEENVDNETTGNVTEKLSSGRTGKLLLEAEESSNNILLNYANFIKNYKEKVEKNEVTKEDTLLFLETYDNFKSDYGRAVGSMAVKKFGSSRQLGVFFPGGSDYDFRVEFGNPVMASNLLTFVFKLPVRDQESWLEKLINYYSNFATTYVAATKNGQTVEALKENGEVITDSKQFNVGKDDIKELKMSNGETLNYVVVPQDTTKVVLDNESFDLKHYSNISNEIITSLKDNEKAYQVKKLNDRWILAKSGESFGNVDREETEETKVAEAEIYTDLVKTISDDMTSKSIGDILDLIQNKDTIVNIGLDNSDDSSKIKGIRQAYLIDSNPKNLVTLFNAVLKNGYGGNKQDIYFSTSPIKVKNLTYKTKHSEAYKDSDEIVGKNNFEDVKKVDERLDGCFEVFLGSPAHITLKENNYPAYFVKFTTPLSSLSSLSGEFLVDRRKGAVNNDNTPKEEQTKLD